jgi:hypothetical protein
MLLLPDGRLVPMRCGASNLCAYCAWIASVENSVVVGLDAKWSQPNIGMTLTTHRPDFDMDRFRVAVANVFRWLRRDRGFEMCEYCGLMEWTTGVGGKGRMPHMHALLKGMEWSDLGGLVADPRSPKNERYALELELREKWESWTGGAWVVDMRPLRTPGGAIAYMVGHHHKRAQAPPRRIARLRPDGSVAYESVKGMKRMRPSKGYFDTRRAEVINDGRTPVQLLRQEARRVMRETTASKRALARLVELDPPPEIRDDILDALIEAARDAPPAVPVAVLPDGRLRHLSTGEVFDGEGRAVYEAAVKRAA